MNYFKNLRSLQIQLERNLVPAHSCDPKNPSYRTRPRWQHLTASTLLICCLMIGTSSCATASSGEPEVRPGPVGFRLPKPTGPYDIGVTELHLIDPERRDPWIKNRPRELMISIWYPARSVARYPLAPYMQPHAAEHFAQSPLGSFALDPSRIDWAGVPTHARAGAPADLREGKRSVVLFSPGGGVPRTLGTQLVEELASHGYLVVTIDHTYEASEVAFPDGRVAVEALPETAPEVYVTLLRKVARVRVQDTRFVLDQLAVLASGNNPDAAVRQLPDGLGSSLDLTRVGMFGHSAGGLTAAQAMYEDSRLAAGINMDGSLGNFNEGDGLEVLPPVARAGLDRPFMLMGGSVFAGQPHTHRSQAWWAVDWRSFWQHSTGWKLDLNMPDAVHFTFTDFTVFLPQLGEQLEIPAAIRPSYLGTVNPAKSIASQRAYITAFFDQHLRGQPRELLAGPSPAHPDVEFIR